MDRAKKRLASALDGFRNFHKSEMGLDEKITADDVCLTGVSDFYQQIFTYFFQVFIVDRVSNYFLDYRRGSN